MDAETLKTRRTQLGYTQPELAAALDVSRSQVAKWENGLRAIPVETAARVAALRDEPAARDHPASSAHAGGASGDAGGGRSGSVPSSVPADAPGVP